MLDLWNKRANKNSVLSDTVEQIAVLVANKNKKHKQRRVEEEKRQILIDIFRHWFACLASMSCKCKCKSCKCCTVAVVRLRSCP